MCNSSPGLKKPENSCTIKLNYDFKEYKQIGKAKRVIIEDMK